MMHGTRVLPTTSKNLVPPAVTRVEYERRRVQGGRQSVRAHTRYSERMKKEDRDERTRFWQGYREIIASAARALQMPENARGQPPPTVSVKTTSGEREPCCWVLRRRGWCEQYYSELHQVPTITNFPEERRTLLAFTTLRAAERKRNHVCDNDNIVTVKINTRESFFARCITSGLDVLLVFDYEEKGEKRSPFRFMRSEKFSCDEARRLLREVMR